MRPLDNASERGVTMRKKPRSAASELPLERNESAEVDLEALKKERERLLKTLERIRNEKRHLQRETNRLFSKAKSLNCILAKSQSEPEYLKRDE